MSPIDYDVAIGQDFYVEINVHVHRIAKKLVGIAGSGSYFINGGAGNCLG
jgi:hypothetical protein